MTSRNRSRRSVLAVPGSSRKMIDKAKGLPADEIFSTSKMRWRRWRSRRPGESIGDALAEDGWGKQVKVVRVNDWTTEWTYADVVEVVGRAGSASGRHSAAQGSRCEPRPGARFVVDAGREGQTVSRSARSGSNRRSRTRSA